MVNVLCKQANKSLKYSIEISYRSKKQFFSSMEHVPLGLVTFSPVISYIYGQIQKDWCHKGKLLTLERWWARDGCAVILQIATRKKKISEYVRVVGPDCHWDIGKSVYIPEWGGYKQEESWNRCWEAKFSWAVRMESRLKIESGEQMEQKSSSEQWWITRMGTVSEPEQRKIQKSILWRSNRDQTLTGLLWRKFLWRHGIIFEKQWPEAVIHNSTCLKRNLVLSS